nr:uncharacterized protein LOC127320997 isoform X2 [Lolium perenne]
MPPSPWTAARLAGQQKRTALISSSPSSASRNLGRQELLEIFHVYTVYVPATSMSSTPATSSASPSSSSSTPGICFFPDRITKWCGEIRQVLLQLFTGTR